MPTSEKLMSGEKVLWKGRQERGPRPFLRTVFASVGGCLSIGFSVLWFKMASDTSVEDNIGIWFGALPGIVGVYAILKAFAETYILRAFTYYTLTNRRAIKSIHLFGHRQSSLLLTDIPEIQLQQHDDGTATILFGRDEIKGSGEDAKKSDAFRFRFVRDAAKVVSAVERLRKYRYRDPQEASPATES